MSPSSRLFSSRRLHHTIASTVILLFAPSLCAAGTSWSDATSGPLGNSGPGRGAAWIDYDGDGDDDLYITNFHPAVDNVSALVLAAAAAATAGNK